MKLAVEFINSDGGINGKPVEIVYEDSESNAKGGVNAMNKLVNVDKVKVVLSQQSPVVVALSPIANENKVILMDTGATTPAYISLNDFTFRVSYSAQHFAQAIVNLLESSGVKKLGILYMNDEYGVGMFNSYKKYFKGEIVSAESFLPEDQDFRTQVQKVKKSMPEALVYVANLKQSGNLLKQTREQGLNIPIYTDTYTIAYPSVLEVAGKAADGVVYAEQEYDFSRSDQLFKKFNDDFVTKYGQPSNPLSAQAYDGLMIVVYAIKECRDPLDTECIKGQLFKMRDFQGIVGQITFDENGEVLHRPTVLKTVKEGKFELYR